MCGLTGVWRSTRLDGDQIASDIKRITNRLRHRGPDAQGCWVNSDHGIGLGHRRLAIQDLSSSGAQPMSSDSGRYVLVFNGEIYNHRDLRDLLGNTNWKGHSDTETLLVAIEAWGLATTLGRAIGMFALAIWDRKNKNLSFARDRLGEKPLYIAKLKEGIAFASELKAFCVLEQFSKDLDPQAVSDFVRLGYVPEGMSIYKCVEKVSPGTIRCYTSPAGEYETEVFWSLEHIVRARNETRAAKFSFSEISSETEAVLSEVVASQMLGDVPLGSFLSGGIDSTAITALMQKHASYPINSFSIGFEEDRFNESKYAAQVAKHLGTDHKEYIVSESDALKLIPDLAHIYDEPFADSSQIPTTLLCRLARQDVTIALTGDGGDEIFGGYNRHVQAPKLWDHLRRIPVFIRSRLHLLAKLMHVIGRRDSSMIRVIYSKLGLPITTVDKLTALGPMVSTTECFEDLYQGLVSTFMDPNRYLAGSFHRNSIWRFGSVNDWQLSKSEWIMVMDTLGYLPGDILVKVDRAAMSASLETRAPFLDQRVVELAWSFPIEAKIADGVGKKVLRDIVARHVPIGIVDRPKQGFSIPLDKWLRGELRDWAESLLMQNSSLIDSESVRVLWLEHLAEKSNNGQRLWNLLMLLEWRTFHSI